MELELWLTYDHFQDWMQAASVNNSDEDTSFSKVEESFRNSFSK